MAATASGSQVQLTFSSGTSPSVAVGGVKATERDIDFLCDLNEASNKGSAAPHDNLYKLGVALGTWKEERQRQESRKESRKAEIREAKTEIYQMIGFYTVVQGVLFQGVSSMSKIESCLKIFCFTATLSGLTSVATIGGVVLKLRDLKQSITQLSDAEGMVQVLEGLLTQLQSSRSQFDWTNAEPTRGFLTALAAMKKDGERNLLLFRIAVVLLLVAFSFIFPVSFYEIMCGL